MVAITRQGHSFDAIIIQYHFQNLKFSNNPSLKFSESLIFKKKMFLLSLFQALHHFPEAWRASPPLLFLPLIDSWPVLHKKLNLHLRCPRCLSFYIGLRSLWLHHYFSAHAFRHLTVSGGSWSIISCINLCLSNWNCVFTLNIPLHHDLIPSLVPGFL